ncbi:MAG: hypothetical protein IPL26_10920 [Leptospiraceae bacterium]|nr:hypothetical protein [Leptospiraceae bacterium]
MVNVNFDLYLNPIEEKDIKHLKVYQDEFAIIKELRKYKISAEYDDIPEKNINENNSHNPKTLKESFVLSKGTLIAIRKIKKSKPILHGGYGNGSSWTNKNFRFQEESEMTLIAVLHLTASIR